MPDGRPSTDGEVIRFEVDVYSLESSRSRKHEAVAKLMLIDGVGTLVVGRDIQDKALALGYLLLAIGIGTACMLVMGLLGGHVMSRWTLGRIEPDQPDHGRASSPATSAGASSSAAPTTSSTSWPGT
jgi:hypothetical protein